MANPCPLTHLHCSSESLNPLPQVLLLLLGPDCSHLEAGDVSFGVLHRGTGGETLRSRGGLFVLGARGNGRLAHRGFWGSGWEGGGPQWLYWLPCLRDRSVLVLPFVFGF